MTGTCIHGRYLNPFQFGRLQFLRQTILGLPLARFVFGLRIHVDRALRPIQPDFLILQSQRPPQVGGQHHTPLRIHLGLGAVVVGHEQERVGGVGIFGSQRFQNFFVSLPHRNRVDSSYAVVHASHEEFLIPDRRQVLL
jgi:hypothetical protein